MLILERPWTRQPQQVVLRDETYLRRKQSLVLLAGVELRATRVNGYGKELHVADNYYYTASAPIADANELTVVLAGRPTAAPGSSYERWFEIGGYLANSGISLEQVAGREKLNGWQSNPEPTTAVTIYWLDANIGQTQGYVLTIKDGVVTCYRGGVSVFSASITANAATSGKVALGGATYSSGATNRANNFGFSLFAVDFGRAVSNSVARSLSANPWQLFSPRRIPIPTATAAATAPTITALSAISITATSAQPRISYS